MVFDFRVTAGFKAADDELFERAIAEIEVLRIRCAEAEERTRQSDLQCCRIVATAMFEISRRDDEIASLRQMINTPYMRNSSDIIRPRDRRQSALLLENVDVEPASVRRECEVDSLSEIQSLLDNQIRALQRARVANINC